MSDKPEPISGSCPVCGNHIEGLVCDDKIIGINVDDLLTQKSCLWCGPVVYTILSWPLSVDVEVFRASFAE